MDLIELLPFDPDNEQHVNELLRQRVLCGWGVEKVPRWREQCRRDDKYFYWVMRGSSDAAATRFTTLVPPIEYKADGEAGSFPPDETFTPMGHAALDWEDYDPDPELASRELGNLQVSGMFLLLSQQGTGLGNLVMTALETLASTLPIFANARYLTLNTFDREQVHLPAFWKALGLPFRPDAPILEDWYARRGYVAFKRVGRPHGFDEEGKQVMLGVVHMRKPILRPP